MSTEMSEEQKQLLTFIRMYNDKMRNLVEGNLLPHIEEKVRLWFRDYGEPTRISIEQEYPDMHDKFINPFDTGGN